MATATEVVTHAWTEWGIQALVLLSFTLQVTLLVLAEFRRIVDSGALRFFTWSAYMLADTTAIYVLGHMSVAGRWLPEQELVAYWALFLLLHLGGQDNITAYAVEDNRLWLRHLQTLAVQVVATAYVLYSSSVLLGTTTPLLRPAAVLVFVVGLVRYGERVWALKRASGSNSNYRSGEWPDQMAWRIHPVTVWVRAEFTGIMGGAMNSEAILLIAHQLLSIPKHLLVGALPSEGLRTDLTGEDAYRVAEMQLSLMHDVFYTKAEVLLTWYGLCVRVASLLAIAVAFVLFQLLLLRDHHARNQGSRYSSLDVGVTYALLVGALALETASVVRLLFSSWTYTLLSDARCHLLARAVVSLRLLVHAADRRRGGWSRSMGQLRLLSLCAPSMASSRSSKIARWMGMEDAWNVWACSSSVPVPALVEEQMVKQLLRPARPFVWSSRHYVVNPWGRQAMERWGLQKDLEWSVEESVLVWHVATDIYLCWYRNQNKDDDGEQARQRGCADAVQVLSGYMLYLLAARPDVIPRPVARSAYVQMCYALLNSREALANWRGLPALDHRSAGNLAASLWRIGNAFNNRGSVHITYGSNVPVIGRSDSAMVITAARLGDKLISEDQSPSTGDDVLQLIFRGWVDMLFYLGCHCTADSHVKQLSNGGELVTVAALLAKYILEYVVMPGGLPAA